MNIETTLNNPLDKSFRLTQNFDALRPMIDAELGRRAKTYKEKGFRPGKVPFDRIKEVFYKEALQKAVYDLVQRESTRLLKGEYPETLEKGLNIAGSSYDLEHCDEDKGVVWTLSVQIQGETEALTWKDCQLIQYEVTTTEADLDQFIEEWARASTTSQPLSPVPEKAENGHTVWVHSKDGGTIKTPLTPEVQERPWEKRLYGVGVGFSWDQALSKAKHGVKKRIHWVVQDIQKTVPCTRETLPEAVGVKDDAALCQEAKKALEKESQRLIKALQQKQVLDFLASQNFEVSESLVEREFQGLWSSLKQQVPQGGTIEDFTEMAQEEAESLYKGVALRRVRTGILIRQQAKVYNITIESDDWKQFLQQECDRYPGQENEVLQYYQNREEARREAHSRMLESKLVQHVWTLPDVTITQETCDFKKLQEVFDQSLESSELSLRTKKKEKGSRAKTKSSKKGAAS